MVRNSITTAPRGRRSSWAPPPQPRPGRMAAFLPDIDPALPALILLKNSPAGACSLFDNIERAKAVRRFVDIVLKGANSPAATTRLQSNMAADAIPQFRDGNVILEENGEEPVEEEKEGPTGRGAIIDAAFSLGRWSVARFQRVIKEIRRPALSRGPRDPMKFNLESLSWSLVSAKASDDGREDETADTEMWTRYVNRVQGKPGPIPIATDPESVMMVINAREGAVDYFKRKVNEELDTYDAEDISAISLHILKYDSSPELMEIILPRLLETVAPQSLSEEIIPRLLVLAVLQTDVIGAPLLGLIVDRARVFITPHAANSALEYCAHLQRLECCRVILDRLENLVRAEGVVAAMIPSCARGADHLIAALELFVMDQCQKATERRLKSENSAGDRSGFQATVGPDGETAAVRDAAQPPPEADTALSTQYVELVPACVYMFLVLAAAGGYAKGGTVTELIEFYGDPCKPFLVDKIPEKQHRRFVRELFNLVCRLNYVGNAWALIAARWLPAEIAPALYNATQKGHQSMVHLLLDSLLARDPLLDPGSAVPIVFRLSSAVTLLPMVAR
ncbi:hypothetical protein BDK51DRAFT_44041, partial [Blyttiomyces helicus]